MAEAQIAQDELPLTGGEVAPDKGSPERLSVRESLERSFKDAHENEQRTQRERDEATGKFKAREEAPAKKAAPAKRAVDEMREAVAGADGEAGAAEAGAASGEAAAAEGEAPEAAAKPATPAPAAWAKEAKAEWEKLPAVVQAAVAKREMDVQKGVDDLKGKYKEIDDSLAPHLPTIRQFGHTPGQAINQLFGWFNALTRDPKVAFPALMQSFGQSQESIFGKPAAPAPAAATSATEAKPGEAATPVELPPAIKQYLEHVQQEIAGLKNEFGQRLGTFQQQVNSQQQAQVNDVLAKWSADKPHYHAVRAKMGQLIQTGIVPLKNGQVDLDGAYETAVRMDPAVWGQVQAEQAAAAAAKAQADAAAKQKAQAEAAEKAKRAAASLTPTSPGAEAAKTKKPAKRSVRESLMDAIEEVRG